MKQIKTRLAGHELPLDVLPDRFVSRAGKTDLEAAGFTIIDQLSKNSYAVERDERSLDEMLEQARGLGAAAYPYYQVQDTRRDFLISDRVFVRFKHPLPEERWEAFAAGFGARVVDSFDAEILVELPPNADPVNVVQSLSSNPDVALAEHDLNHQVRPFSFPLPQDPVYPAQWHLHDDVEDPNFNRRTSLRADDAWDLLNGFGTSDVVVGVTDGGFNLANPDFTTDKFAGWGFFRDSKLVTHLDPGANPADLALFARHGTAMAALIGASPNGAFSLGVAPGCRLLPIRFEQAGRHLLVSCSATRKAFRFLSRHVDVISNSWGTGEDTSWGRMVSEEVEKIAVSGGRRGKGVVFVWAAGNSNCPIARDFIADVDVPIDRGRRNNTFTPPTTARRFRNDMVGIPGVIHVGAVSSNGKRSHYSNYGSGLRLCAPSTNEHFYGCHEIVGQSLCLRSSPPLDNTRDLGGTSVSAALAAGAAALVISANPSLTSVEVVSILQRTSNKDLDMTRYTRTEKVCGAGLGFTDEPFDVSPVPPFESGHFRDVRHADGTWSPWFGFGSVNAAEAVKLAIARRGGPAAPKRK